MRGKSEFLFPLRCLLGGCVNIQFTVTEHIDALSCGFVISHIGKSALQIFGDPLHHLISVSGMPSILILHVVAVKSIECNFVIWCLCIDIRRCIYRTY